VAEEVLDLIAHIYGGRSLVQFILQRNTTLRNVDQDIDLDWWISPRAELVSGDAAALRLSFCLSDLNMEMNVIMFKIRVIFSTLESWSAH
jgi:hypothetical protein